VSRPFQFEAADGRTYGFRALVKDATLDWPKSIRSPMATNIAQDQISGTIPGAVLLAGVFERAVDGDTPGCDLRRRDRDAADVVAHHQDLIEAVANCAVCRPAWLGTVGAQPDPEIGTGLLIVGGKLRAGRAQHRQSLSDPLRPLGRRYPRQLLGKVDESIHASAITDRPSALENLDVVRSQVIQDDRQQLFMLGGAD
jgi:hypothetical protein